jgi:hypothetical protein
MRARWLLVLAVSCGAVGFAAWLWSSTRPAPLPAAPPVAAPIAEPKTPDVAPAAAPAAPTRVSDADAKSSKHWWDGFVPGRREKAARDVVAKEPAAKIALDGLVVVKDRDGREHLDENGTLNPGFYDPPREPAPAKDEDEDEAPATASALSKRNFHRSWQNGEPIEVEGGRFHVEVPSDREFGATRLEVGGRIAVVDSEPTKAVAGQPVTIRAHWIDPIRVHVVDRETKAELDDVTVARSTSLTSFALSDDDPGSPDELDRVVEHGHSPVEVPPQARSFGPEMQGHVWIRAPDHAWRGVALDYDDLSERTVELTGAATLVVDVQGELPSASSTDSGLGAAFAKAAFGQSHHARDDHDRDPMLRLRKPAEVKPFDDAVKEMLAQYDVAKPSDFPGGRKPPLDEFKKMIESMREQYEAETSRGELVTERPAHPGEIRFESLAVQELVASIEVGASYRAPLVITSAPAKLVAGETTKVVLVAHKVETPMAVALAGSILVPPGWDLDQLSLEIEPVDLKGQTRDDEHRIPSERWTALPGRAGAYRWNAGAVLPATYMVLVKGAGIVKQVVVPASGDPNVEIVLPESALLRVRVVASADGTPVKMKNLEWQPHAADLTAEEFAGLATVDLEYDAARKSFGARVPVGPGSLVANFDEKWVLDGETATIEVHAGEQELVAKAHPICGVSFDLACDGAKVAWNERDSWQIQVVRSDGVSRIAWSSFRDTHPVIAVAEPGRYTVTLPAIDGYEPVAPFEIEIPAGQFLQKTVELRKKR